MNSAPAVHDAGVGGEQGEAVSESEPVMSARKRWQDVEKFGHLTTG